MKRAWIFGDSHAAGSGICPHNPSREYQESYPCHLAGIMGYTDIRNHSISGHSNDAIFRWVTESLPDIHSDDIVILCWSEEARTEVWSDMVDAWLHIIPPGQGVDYDLWYQKRPCSNAGLGVIDPFGRYPRSVQEYYARFRSAWQKILNTDHDLKTYRMNFVKNCLAANSVLQHIAKVINVRSQASLQLAYDGTLHPLLEHEYWPVGGTVFRDWALQQGFCEDRYHHLPLPAHVAFAQFVHSRMMSHACT